MEEFKYDVFLSYRHRTLDSEITQKTFNYMESYRLPKSLKAKGYQDIRRAFRDAEELSVSKILTSTIDDALASTNCMILICSTDAPLSPWVDREVSNFIELGRADYIYPLLISGDPDISFPPSLKLVPDIMDRLMDIRVPGNDTKAMMAKAETELLKVIAGVTGCELPELQREHELRKNRRFLTRAVSAAAAFLLVGGVSLGLMNAARDYRDTAQKQQKTSMLILQQLTYDLPDKLTNVAGAYERIGGILEENTREINEILRLAPRSVEAEAEIAANTTRLATALYGMGRYDAAEEQQRNALEMYISLRESGWENADVEVYSAYSNLGKILQSEGRFEESAVAYEKALEEKLSIRDGDDLVLARLCFNVGSCATDAGLSGKAIEYYDRALATLDRLEETSDMLILRAQTRYEYGVILYHGGRLPEAQELLLGSCADYSLLSQMVDSLQNRNSHVLAASALAACFADSGEYEDATFYYKNAMEMSEALAVGSDDVSKIQNLAQICSNYGLLLNMQGDFTGADGLYTRSAEYYLRVWEKTGTSVDRMMYALVELNSGENAFKMGDMERSRKAFETGLRSFDEAQQSLQSNYYTSLYYSWLSYYQLIHLQDAESAIDSAFYAYELQPDNLLANLNLAYASLYYGNRDNCEALFPALASLGAGQIDTIRLDLAAQSAAGLESDYLEDVYAILDYYEAQLLSESADDQAQEG